MADSRFEVEGLAKLSSASQKTLESYFACPSRLHSLLIRTYELNWRACLRHWGGDFEKMVSRTNLAHEGELL